MKAIIAGLCAIPILLYGVLVLDSAVYCYVTDQLDMLTWPYLQWWIVVTTSTVKWWRLACTGIGIALPVLILVAVSAPVRLCLNGGRQLRRPFFGGLRPIKDGVTDNYGHARWATKQELSEAFGGEGCLIGAASRDASPQFLFDNLGSGPLHSLIFSGPGSFKTTTAVTRIWKWKGPRVVFDPSCEIGPIMTEALERSGCDVRTIGINNDGMNPLDWIDVSDHEADAHIRSMVDLIYDENATKLASGGQSKDPFWSQWGRSLITCLLAHMLFENQQNYPATLATLRQGISTPEDVMQTSILPAIHSSSSSSMAREIAGGLMGIRAPQTFSGIYSNAFAATDWLSVRSYARMVSGNSMSTSDILRGNTVVFIQTPLRSLLATPAIGRVVLGSFMNAMYHADGRGIDDRILFEIDEAWTLGKLNEIKLGYTTARKYGGLIQTLWQSEGQMEGVWGPDDAKMLRDSASWRAYGAVQDGNIAEKLSKDIGERSVMAYSEGSSSGTQANQFAFIGSRSRGSNVNIHEIKRRLIKADEITRADPDELFVLARGFPYPIRCFAAPYFRYPSINAAMGCSRFVRDAAE